MIRSLYSIDIFLQFAVLPFTMPRKLSPGHHHHHRHKSFAIRSEADVQVHYEDESKVTTTSAKKFKQFLHVPVDTELEAIRAQVQERKRREGAKADIPQFNELPPPKRKKPLSSVPQSTATSALTFDRLLQPGKNSVPQSTATSVLTFDRLLQPGKKSFPQCTATSIQESKTSLSSEGDSAVSDDYISPDENSFAETKYYLKQDYLFPNFENKFATIEDEETRITNRLVIDYMTVPTGKKYREWLPQIVDKDEINHVLEDIPGGLTDEEFFENGISWLDKAECIIIRPAGHMKKKFGTVRFFFKNMYIIAADSEPTRMFYMGERYANKWVKLLRGARPYNIHVFDFECRVTMYIEKPINCELFCFGGDCCNSDKKPYHTTSVYAYGDKLQSKVMQIRGKDSSTPYWAVSDKDDKVGLFIVGPKGILKNYSRLKWDDIKDMKFTVLLPDWTTEAGSIVRKSYDPAQMLSPSWSLVINCAKAMPADAKCGLIAATMLFSKQYMQIRHNWTYNIRYTGVRIALLIFILIIIAAIFIAIRYIEKCLYDLDCMYVYTGIHIKPPA